MTAPAFTAALALLTSSAPASPPQADIPNIVVTAQKDPAVVAVYPTEGAKVAGGVVILKVTFDRSMTADAWSYAPSPGGQLPECLARPRLLADGRSFALLCSLPINMDFALEINAAPGFVSAAGRLAKPYQMHFSTTGDMVRTVEAGLTAAGLSENDNPIMGIGVLGAAGSTSSGATPKP